MDTGVVDEVVVATDDARVVSAVAPLGVAGVLTGPGHRSGTERVAEVVRMGSYADAELVLNVQGDEPFLPVEAVTAVVSLVRAGAEVATAAVPLGPEDALDPNRVKVIVDEEGSALGFSRTVPARSRGIRVLHHLGVYGYRRDALLRWVGLPAVAQEEREGLEQLRPLAHGIRIGVAEVNSGPVRGIDTEDDLAWAETYLAQLTERIG